MKVEPTSLPEVLIVEPRWSGDARGFFQETWHLRRYAEAGVDAAFVQDNVSLSARNVLRGLHLQHPHGQGKLIWVMQGAVFDVAVDLRTGSPTFGGWAGAELSAQNRRQLWIPEGFAHGFCVLGETALLAYKCTDFYTPDSELTVRWDDPAIGIEWPVSDPVLSDKDAAAPRLAELETARLPVYRPAG